MIMVKIILSEWFSILLILFSFILLYWFWKIKKSKLLTTVLAIILFLHHFIAIFNIYFISLPGAEGDPVKFYYKAKRWALSGKFIASIGTDFYIQFLGVFYRIFGASKLLGAELSVLVFLLSCFILIKIVELLKSEQYVVLILLGYGLLPTNLVFCSKILREPYQLFFFISAVYWGLRFHLKPVKGAFILCMLSALLMGFFQRALMVYTIILLPIILLWFPQQNLDSSPNKAYFNKQKIISIIIALVIILGIIIAGIIFNVGDMSAVKSFLTGQGFQFAADYRAKAMFKTAIEARANYGIILDTSSLLRFIKSISLIYIYYLFAPFPWQVSKLVDIYGLAESLLRFTLIGLSILFWYKDKDINKRRIWGLFLLIYFTMTFLWAMGTINYGQAIRHHLLTNWLIIILGINGLMNFLNDIQAKKYHNTL